MRRVLAGGGKAVICFTCKGSLQHKGFAKEIHLYESGDIERMLAAAEFIDIQTAFFADKYRRYCCVSSRACSE
jgi:hypothetical protein